MLLPIWALIFVAYFGVWNFGFIYDDYPHLVENANIHSLAPLSKFFTDRTLFIGHENFSLWRPAATFESAVLWQIFGVNPAGYHIINLILHAINTGLVYWIFFMLFGRRVIAGAATAVFALHPTAAQAVASIASQNSLLVTFFFLAAFLLVLKNKYSTFSLGLFFLALLTKEVAILGAIIFFAYYWLLEPGKESSFKQALVKSRPFILAEILYLISRFIFLPFFIGEATFYPSLIPVVFYTYIKSIFWPFNFYVLDALPKLDFLPASFFDHHLLIGIVLIFFVGLLFYIFYKNRLRMELFGLIWFVVFMLPVVQIIPAASILGVRIMYLPIIGILIVIASLIKNKATTRQKKMAGVIFAILLVIFSFGSYDAARVWENSEVFWIRFLVKFPDSNIASHNLSMYFMNNGYDRGQPAIQGVGLRDLWSGDPFLRILSNQGLPGDYELAEKHFLEILNRNPEDEVTYKNLQILYKIEGKIR